MGSSSNFGLESRNGYATSSEEQTANGNWLTATSFLMIINGDDVADEEENDGDEHDDVDDDDDVSWPPSISVSPVTRSVVSLNPCDELGH